LDFLATIAAPSRQIMPYSRRNHLVPVPRVQDLAELNKLLLRVAKKMGNA